MTEVPSPTALGNQLRLLRMVLARFSQASGLLLTQPVAQYSPVTGTLKISVGYIGGGGGDQAPLSINLVNVLSDYLSSALGVKVCLLLIRLQNHYSEPSLLAQYLAGLIGGGVDSSSTFKSTVTRLAKFLAFSADEVAPMTVKGVRVRVSGRLTVEPTRPRQTTQEFTLRSTQHRSSTGRIIHRCKR